MPHATAIFSSARWPFFALLPITISLILNIFSFANADTRTITAFVYDTAMNPLANVTVSNLDGFNTYSDSLGSFTISRTIEHPGQQSEMLLCQKDGYQFNISNVSENNKILLIKTPAGANPNAQSPQSLFDDEFDLDFSASPSNNHRVFVHGNSWSYSPTATIPAPANCFFKDQIDSGLVTWVIISGDTRFKPLALKYKHKTGTLNIPLFIMRNKYLEVFLQDPLNKPYQGDITVEDSIFPMSSPGQYLGTCLYPQSGRAQITADSPFCTRPETVTIPLEENLFPESHRCRLQCRPDRTLRLNVSIFGPEGTDLNGQLTCNNILLTEKGSHTYSGDITFPDDGILVFEFLHDCDQAPLRMQREISPCKLFEEEFVLSNFSRTSINVDTTVLFSNGIDPVFVTCNSMDLSEISPTRFTGTIPYPSSGELHVALWDSLGKEVNSDTKAVNINNCTVAFYINYDRSRQPATTLQFIDLVHPVAQLIIRTPNPGIKSRIPSDWRSNFESYLKLGAELGWHNIVKRSLHVDARLGAILVDGFGIFLEGGPSYTMLVRPKWGCGIFTSIGVTDHGNPTSETRNGFFDVNGGVQFGFGRGQNPMLDGVFQVQLEACSQRIPYLDSRGRGHSETVTGFRIGLGTTRSLGKVPPIQLQIGFFDEFDTYLSLAIKK